MKQFIQVKTFEEFVLIKNQINIEYIGIVIKSNPIFNLDSLYIIKSEGKEIDLIIEYHNYLKPLIGDIDESVKGFFNIVQS